jgi:septum formation protein
MTHLLTPIPQLVLASSSPYRKELVSRLCVPFICHAPNVDETPLLNETPLNLSQRLALSKAHAVAKEYPNAFVIGSDQVLNLNGEALGKPHTHDNAVAMLKKMRGQTMQFITAVAVVHGTGKQANSRTGTSTVTVKFKDLSDAAIEQYLRLDTPYDCAGSCKSETLGIALCEYIHSDDPTSQVGLPLILTLKLLGELGYNMLDYAGQAAAQ